MVQGIATATNFDSLAGSILSTFVVQYCIFAGCTDSEASNFASQATYDDGSCLTPLSGCMDSSAANYLSAATVDAPAECVSGGCRISSSLNYASSATFDDGSCTPRLAGCTLSSAANFLSQASADDGSCALLGCTSSLACWTPLICLASLLCAHVYCMQAGP